MDKIYKLGRKAVKRDSRTLCLATYLTPILPPPPPAVDWTGGVLSGWGMMLNDDLGDCTIAGAAHAVQVWTKNASAEETISDPQVLSIYVAWDGYVPGNAATDNGGIELDVLNTWRQQGFCGHSLQGYASANPKNLTEIRQAIQLFGGVYIGLSLPVSAQTQDVWDVVPGDPDGTPGSWGGHCVYVTGYDPENFACITWGAVKKMTTAFFLMYCDEAYALFGGDWINTGGTAPSGFKSDQLLADLALIK